MINYFLKKHFVFIDFGSINTKVYNEKENITYNEKSIILYEIQNYKKTKILNIGEKVKNFIGKNHPGIEIFFPIKNGIIQDFDVCVDYFKSLFKKTKINLKNLNRYFFLFTISKNVNDLEKNFFIKLLKTLKIKNFIIEEQIKISAIGVGIDISFPNGNLIIDIGGGTSDVALIASGDIIVSKSIDFGSIYIINEITKYIKKKHNLNISYDTSEKILKNFSLLNLLKNKKNEQTILGKDKISFLPKKINIDINEIKIILIPFLTKISNLVYKLLESSKNEIITDLITNGIFLTGGFCNLKGIEKYFEDVFNFTIRINHNPKNSIIKGAIKYKSVVFKKIFNKN